MTAATVEAVDLEQLWEEDRRCEMLKGKPDDPWVICGAPASYHIHIRHSCGYDVKRFYCETCYQDIKDQFVYCRNCGQAFEGFTWKSL